jgi:hypothetical protein
MITFAYDNLTEKLKTDDKFEVCVALHRVAAVARFIGKRDLYDQMVAERNARECN